MSLHAHQRLLDDLVERWFAALTENNFAGVPVAPGTGGAIRRYIDITNERPKPFRWTQDGR